MFILTRILGMFLLLSQCNNSVKQSVENPIAQSEVVISKEGNSMIQEELLNVTYQATSRGAFYQVVIDKNAIKKSKDRSLNDTKEKLCSKNEWVSIQSQLENIELENIKDLKVPSDDRATDKSLHATLAVAFSGQVYRSVSFDHGNPPEQLASLVNTILSLAESIE